MKIALIGATGQTGIEFTEMALEAGHELTCIARTPSKITREDDNLSVTQGDVLDADSLVAGFRGQDALVGAFGIPAGPTNITSATTLYSDGIRNVLRAMEEAGLDRLVMISSSANVHDPDSPWFWNNILRPLSWKMYADMLQMEVFICETDFDWTVVRPPLLVDRPETGDLKVAIDAFPDGSHEVTRKDLARFLLREVEEKTYLRKRAVVAG